MPSVLERLVRGEEIDENDDLLDGSPELEAATEEVGQALKKRAAGEPASSSSAAGIDTNNGIRADEPEEKVASEPRISPKFTAQVEGAIAECEKLAADYGGAVKTASAADRPGYEAQGLLFAKVAHLLKEQKRVLDGQRKYAHAVLEQSVEARRLHEALKVASECLDDGSMVIPADTPLMTFIENIAKRDPSAVKTAHELFVGQVAELGDAVERSKTASDELPRADGSMASWLRHHPSLTHAQD